MTPSRRAQKAAVTLVAAAFGFALAGCSGSGGAGTGRTPAPCR